MTKSIKTAYDPAVSHDESVRAQRLIKRRQENGIPDEDQRGVLFVGLSTIEDTGYFQERRPVAHATIMVNEKEPEMALRDLSKSLEEQGIVEGRYIPSIGLFGARGSSFSFSYCGGKPVDMYVIEDKILEIVANAGNEGHLTPKGPVTDNSGLAAYEL